MKTAVGSCLFTSVAIDHITTLEEIFSVFTQDGCVIPHWLTVLRKESK